MQNGAHFKLQYVDVEVDGWIGSHLKMVDINTEQNGCQFAVIPAAVMAAILIYISSY